MFMSTNTKATLMVFGPVIAMIAIWNYTVRKPQIDAMEGFLEALKNQDKQALSQVVEPSEYPTYRDLYTRRGFNKRLLDYSDWIETDANGYIFPTRSKFALKVKEKDVFFGVRTKKYYILLEKKTDGWKVVQFASLQDAEDLEALKRFNPNLKPQDQ